MILPVVSDSGTKCLFMSIVTFVFIFSECRGVRARPSMAKLSQCLCNANRSDYFGQVRVRSSAGSVKKKRGQAQAASICLHWLSVSLGARSASTHSLNSSRFLTPKITELGPWMESAYRCANLAGVSPHSEASCRNPPARSKSRRSASSSGSSRSMAEVSAPA